jgi:hypothetical protein
MGRSNWSSSTRVQGVYQEPEKLDAAFVIDFKQEEPLTG